MTSAVQASVAAGYEQGNAGSSGVHPATNSSSVQVIEGPPGHSWWSLWIWCGQFEHSE